MEDFFKFENDFVSNYNNNSIDEINQTPINHEINSEVKPFRESKKDFNKVTKLESFHKPKKSPSKINQSKVINSSKSNLKQNQDMANHVKNLELHNNFIKKSKSVISTRIDSNMSNYPLAQKIAKQKINQKKLESKKTDSNLKQQFITNFNENIPNTIQSPQKNSPKKINKSQIKNKKEQKSDEKQNNNKPQYSPDKYQTSKEEHSEFIKKMQNKVEKADNISKNTINSLNTTQNLIKSKEKRPNTALSQKNKNSRSFSPQKNEQSEQIKMKNEIENYSKAFEPIQEFRIGNVIEPNSNIDDNFLKLTNKISILENENKSITDNIDSKIIQLETLQNEFSKVKKLINSDFYGNSKIGIEFNHSEVQSQNLQVRQSQGVNTSQISHSSSNKFKKQTKVPSLHDTKKNKENMSSQLKNKNLDKQDSLKDIVEQSDSQSFTMSNSLEANKKNIHDSKNTSMNKLNLEVINENNENIINNNLHIKKVDKDPEHLLQSDTFTNVQNSQENKNDSQSKNVTHNFKNQSFANTFSKNPINKTDVKNEKVITFGQKVDLKNENILQSKIKNNYIHDQAYIPEVIKFDDGKSLKRTKSTGQVSKNKPNYLKSFNNTNKVESVDSQIVKEIFSLKNQYKNMERKFDDLKSEKIQKEKSHDKENRSKLIESRYKDSNNYGNEYSGMNSALLTQYNKAANDYMNTINNFQVENEVINVREDLQTNNLNNQIRNNQPSQKFDELANEITHKYNSIEYNKDPIQLKTPSFAHNLAYQREERMKMLRQNAQQINSKELVNIINLISEDLMEEIHGSITKDLNRQLENQIEELVNLELN